MKAKFFLGQHVIVDRNFYLYTDDPAEAAFGEQVGFSMSEITDINLIKPDAVINVSIQSKRTAMSMETLILTIYPSDTSSPSI